MILVSVYLVLSSIACSDPQDIPTRTLLRAIGMAVTCTVGGTAGDCSAEGAVAGKLWIADADRGAVSIVNPDTGVHLDTDTYVPGHNALPVGDDLVDIRVGPDAGAVFVLSRSGRELVRIDPANLELVRQPLPCTPGSFRIVDEGPVVAHLDGFSAVVACFEPPGILTVPLEGLGELDADELTLIPVSGRPYCIDVPDDGTSAFLTHRPDVYGISDRVGFLSRVDLATYEEVRCGIDPACSDGLDNDGDGFTDHEDSGCLGATDDDESPDAPDICSDGIDNDRDGFTDMDDADCGSDDQHLSEFHLVPWPECMNMKDDDGDGFSDAPNDQDCYGPGFNSESTPAPAPIGCPAVSPDGEWVYVPVTGTPGIAVIEASSMERVDVNAQGGPSPNALLEHLGIKDIRLSVTPVELCMDLDDADESGGDAVQATRAFVSTSSGQVVRILVDEDGASIHALEEVEEDERLSASAGIPILRVDGEIVDRTVDLHPEYPSLGPRTVSPVPGIEDTYSYYGIVFKGDPALELSETWRITFEGVVPGAEGEFGFYIKGDSELLDPTVDLCAAGVEAGDHLVLEPVPPTCLEDTDSGIVNVCEFEILSAGPDRMELAPIEGYASLDALASMPAPLTWVVRVASSWTVQGSRSGFLHNVVSSEGMCVHEENADPMFGSRAYTSFPYDDQVFMQCPPIDEDPGIDWRPFENMAFGFHIIPPCRTDEDFEMVIVDEIRDTELSFVVSGGITPRVVGTGGISEGLTVVNDTLYFVDTTSGAIFVVDADSLEIKKTFY